MAQYTKEGDTGRSSTKTRMNIPKNSPVFELIGTLEECDAQLGLAARSIPAAILPLAEEIRKDILLVRDEVAGRGKFATTQQTEKLEAAIAAMTSSLPESVPSHASSAGGAAIEIARTVLRRAERCAVTASQTGGITRELLAFLNRLSTLLYVLTEVCDASAPQRAPSPAQVSAPSGYRGALPLCDMAMTLCQAVRAHSREMGFPCVVTVCDAGGNPVMLLRDDDALIASVDIAENKAFTAVSVKMTTAELAELAKPGGSLYGIQETNRGRIVIFGGGAPLVRDGAIIGGLGVSGGTAEQDTALCDYGIDFFTKEM